MMVDVATRRFHKKWGIEIGGADNTASCWSDQAALHEQSRRCKRSGRPVILGARTNPAIDFNISVAARRLQEIGLMVRTEDRFVGYSNFKLNSDLIEVLKDILFPRDESGFAPFFKGI